MTESPLDASGQRPEEGGAVRRDYSTVPDVASIPGLYDTASPTPEGWTAPDGKPWAKCCEECAYRDKRQHHAIEAACRDQNAAFYCVHQETETGCSRVCAGFASRDSLRPRPSPRGTP